jgi:hypothetical protein
MMKQLRTRNLYSDGGDLWVANVVISHHRGRVTRNHMISCASQHKLREALVPYAGYVLSAARYETVELKIGPFVRQKVVKAEYLRLPEAWWFCPQLARRLADEVSPVRAYRAVVSPLAISPKSDR